MPLSEIAYAKINLALHVRRRRDDGYHDIETVFAFIDSGDRLTARPAQQDTLSVVGDFAHQLTDPFGNIVAKALSAVPRRAGLAITLEKSLPVAAGLGGGSADAGAVFRLIRDMQGLPHDWRERAARLGADVPACVESRTCIGRGTGTELEPVANDLEGASVLLVNPRVPLPTAAVFAAWDGTDRGPLVGGPVSSLAAAGRNDLERPATALCPAVEDVLAALRDTGADLVRMSGSGATCFGLFRHHDVMLDAAREVAARDPAWWQMAGRLR